MEPKSLFESLKAILAFGFSSKPSFFRK